jgi:hypothetical protein
MRLLGVFLDPFGVSGRLGQPQAATLSSLGLQSAHVSLSPFLLCRPRQQRFSAPVHSLASAILLVRIYGPPSPSGARMP